MMVTPVNGIEFVANDFDWRTSEDADIENLA
jgi:hypothetical protein